MKCRAMFGSAVKCNGSAVQCHEAAGDAQTQTDSFPTPPRRVCLDERFENSLLQFRGNTRTRIRNPEMDVRELHLSAEDDCSARRKFERVAQQIDENLPQPHRVGVQNRQVIGNV